MSTPLQLRPNLSPVFAYVAMGLVVVACVVPEPARVVASLALVISLVAWLIAANRRSIAKVKRRRLHPGPFSKVAPGGDEPPPSFDFRLANFLHCDEGRLKDPAQRYESKMPFWSAVDFRNCYGPKPAWLIRRILDRIRIGARRITRA